MCLFIMLLFSLICVVPCDLCSCLAVVAGLVGVLAIAFAG